MDSDKPWNQWLREEIPQLFVEALSVFMVCDCLELILLYDPCLQHHLCISIHESKTELGAT